MASYYLYVQNSKWDWPTKCLNTYGLILKFRDLYTGVVKIVIRDVH